MAVDALAPPPPVREPGSPPRPPREGDGGGGDGDGGGGRPGGSGPPVSPGKLGVLVFCVFVTMLFAGFLSVYVIVRGGAATWPPPGFPPLPAGLWVSTVLIVASSACLVAADRAARRGRLLRCRHALALTVGLGVAFLATQAWLWGDCVLHGLRVALSQYGALFFSMTGLHALHVLGGLVVLAYAWIAALRASDTRALRTRIELTGLYWHCVGLIWVALFVALYLA